MGKIWYKIWYKNANNFCTSMTIFSFLDSGVQCSPCDWYISPNLTKQLSWSFFALLGPCDDSTLKESINSMVQLNFACCWLLHETRPQSQSLLVTGVASTIQPEQFPLPSGAWAVPGGAAQYNQLSLAVNNKPFQYSYECNSPQLSWAAQQCR